jgi:hypothetical protein
VVRQPVLIDQTHQEVPHAGDKTAARFASLATLALKEALTRGRPRWGDVSTLNRISWVVDDNFDDNRADMKRYAAARIWRL